MKGVRSAGGRTAPRSWAAVGGFAGLFDAQRAAAYRRPLLASSTRRPGLGTKKVAHRVRALEIQRTRSGGLVANGWVRDDNRRGWARSLSVMDELPSALRQACTPAAHSPTSWRGILPKPARRRARLSSAGRRRASRAAPGPTTMTWRGAAVGVRRGEELLGPTAWATATSSSRWARAGCHSNGLLARARTSLAPEPRHRVPRRARRIRGRSSQDTSDPHRAVHDAAAGNCWPSIRAPCTHSAT